MRRMIALASLLVGVALVACTTETSTEGGGKQPKRHAVKSGDGGGGTGHSHARPTWLGKTGTSLEVNQLGNPAPGAELAFEVAPMDDGMIDADVKLEAWLVSREGEEVSGHATMALAGTAYHFHLSAAKDKAAPAKLALRFVGVKDAKVEHVGLQPGWGPHDGLLAFLREQGEDLGRVEIKLHDDKGDVELWLTGVDGKPLDLPLETTVNLIFPYESRCIELSVRNREKNEDEDGKANVRDGKTNYFIFPGDTGADPTWLKGAKFQAAANVAIQRGDGSLMSDVVWLVPHTHGDGHGHDHEHGAGQEHGEKAPAEKNG